MEGFKSLVIFVSFVCLWRLSHRRDNANVCVRVCVSLRLFRNGGTASVSSGSQ